MKYTSLGNQNSRFLTILILQKFSLLAYPIKSSKKEEEKDLHTSLLCLKYINKKLHIIGDDPYGDVNKYEFFSPHHFSFL
jgi:hypothetical protein